MQVQTVFAKEEPVALFLTWQQDPTTTMTIDWHTEPDDQAISVIYYKAPGDDQWIGVESSRIYFPSPILQ